MTLIVGINSNKCSPQKQINTFISAVINKSKDFNPLVQKAENTQREIKTEEESSPKLLHFSSFEGPTQSVRIFAAIFKPQTTEESPLIRLFYPLDQGGKFMATRRKLLKVLTGEIKASKSVLFSD